MEDDKNNSNISWLLSEMYHDKYWFDVMEHRWKQRDTAH